jgi:uncharacterized protein YjbI with pentapeptide repeats
MANPEHLHLLKQGIDVWNTWRKGNRRYPDLRGANLSDANLCGANLQRVNFQDANFSRANLSGVHLIEAYLERANLSGANLSGAYLIGTYLIGTDLSRVNLSGANLRDSSLRNANLTGADLSGANLSRAVLDRTILVNAKLTGATVYGIAAWNVELQGATQNNLVITSPGEPTITVDHLEVAQFIYLLLSNPKIREVIDTIARKAVLILGRFTPERKAVLDALREALRTHGYVPILFDFDRPSSCNVTETVKTLAHLSRFIIADLTDPSSIPYELAQIVPGLAVPVQPVLLEGNRAFAMFPDLPRTYHWVLSTYSYIDQAHLLATLQEHVIAPAEQKAQELENR